MLGKEGIVGFVDGKEGTVRFIFGGTMFCGKLANVVDGTVTWGRLGRLSVGIAV